MHQSHNIPWRSLCDNLRLEDCTNACHPRNCIYGDPTIELNHTQLFPKDLPDQARGFRHFLNAMKSQIANFAETEKQKYSHLPTSDIEKGTFAEESSKNQRRQKKAKRPAVAARAERYTVAKAESEIARQDDPEYLNGRKLFTDAIVEQRSERYCTRSHRIGVHLNNYEDSDELFKQLQSFRAWMNNGTQIGGFNIWNLFSRLEALKVLIELDALGPIFDLIHIPNIPPMSRFIYFGSEFGLEFGLCKVAERALRSYLFVNVVAGFSEGKLMEGKKYKKLRPFWVIKDDVDNKVRNWHAENTPHLRFWRGIPAGRQHYEAWVGAVACPDPYSVWGLLRWLNPSLKTISCEGEQDIPDYYGGFIPKDRADICMFDDLSRTQEYLKTCWRLMYQCEAIAREAFAVDGRPSRPDSEPGLDWERIIARELKTLFNISGKPRFWDTVKEGGQLEKHMRYEFLPSRPVKEKGKERLSNRAAE